METATQAREREMRHDKRRHEARVIGHAIFAEIRDLLLVEAEPEVYERLLATLYQNGVLLVRDDERAYLGLESRDEKGWTMSERVKYEQDRISAMTRTASFVVNLSDADRESISGAKQASDKEQG